jgi:hypothetical protein
MDGIIGDVIFPGINDPGEGILIIFHGCVRKTESAVI